MRDNLQLRVCAPRIAGQLLIKQRFVATCFDVLWQRQAAGAVWSARASSGVMRHPPVRTAVLLLLCLTVLLCVLSVTALPISRHLPARCAPIRRTAVQRLPCRTAARHGRGLWAGNKRHWRGRTFKGASRMPGDC
eukprot:358996-Chlamydomonas_euryale.AAC.6